jgi:pantoate--beta-alanine ligase
MSVKMLHDIDATRRAVRRWRSVGARIALVPTMGNLHEGHLSLMRLARKRADRVVASVFVNPTQFGPTEDYARYPRTLRADKRILDRAGVDALFVPSVGVIYPGGEARGTTVSVPALARELCGAFRPVHFDGVSSVVLRLFNIVAPDLAVFGEKDYQQLVLVRQMVRDLHLPVRIVGAPTVREADGLAMSSRNQYLTAEQRATAPALYRTLVACRERLLEGQRSFGAIERGAMRSLRGLGFRPDYVAIRDESDLAPPDRTAARLRVLAAAWLGRARLIDNVSVRCR